MSQKKFKLVLLTSMVTTSTSLAAGDEIEVGNDEAWALINGDLAALKNAKGKNKQEPPEKPAHIVEAEEKAAEEARAQLQMELPTVHPEGKELNAALEKNAALRAASTQQVGQIASLGETVSEQAGTITALEEEVDNLQEAVESLKKERGELQAEVARLEEEKVALEQQLAEATKPVEKTAEAEAGAAATETADQADTDAAGGEPQ
ncbi:hypothetical protein [Microbulbifer sp. JSM ZJ756]|uniref:hypothetical protein n=1 Tax=Microbulbifer sp. JSM ZJ756 TaxID=3376191 RepID=UPI0037B39671